MLLRLHAHSQPGVVLILGCQPWQKELLCREVKRHDPSIEPPVEINNEVKSCFDVTVSWGHGEFINLVCKA